jgi:CRP/FNR family transcriptional regulator, cyclic AMP receptor protein
MMKVTAAALASQRSLREMQPDQLAALATTATEVMFPARHRIFADGGNADRFWLIESGYVTLDVNVPGEGQTIIGRIGIGGLLGWSWLVPPYQWLFGAVCVTEVRAIEFNAPAVRERCAADPALQDELIQRLFEVTALRLRDTAAKLTTRDFWSRPEGLDARSARAMS